MATSLSEFVSEVMPQVIGCPEFVIKRAIRKAIENFCEKTWCLYEEFNHEISEGDVNDTTLNDAITVDISSYSSSRRPIALTNLKLDGIGYYAEKRVLDSLITDFDSIQKYDTKYFYFPDNDSVVIYPFTDEDANLFMKIIFKTLPTVTTVDDFFYYDYLEYLAAGAASILQMMPKKKWTNPLLAAENKRKFMAGVGKYNTKTLLGSSDRPQHVYSRGWF